MNMMEFDFILFRDTISIQNVIHSFFMAQIVIKSFRLPVVLVKKIKHLAKENSISQAEVLKKIVNAYEIAKLEEQYHSDLERMGKDKKYQQEQVGLANENYL